MRDVATESATDNLVEDLISNEDNENTSKDNPAQGEEDKGDHVEELVAVGVRLGRGELNLDKRVSKSYFTKLNTNLPGEWCHYLQEKL